MTDTQPAHVDETAKEHKQIHFLRSLISVFKENRDVLPSLPEMFECLIANEGNMPNQSETRIVEEYRNSREKLMIKLETAEKQLKLKEEELKSLRTESQKKEKEFAKIKEISKKGKDKLEAVKEEEQRKSKVEELETKDRNLEAATKQVKIRDEEIESLKTELQMKEKEMSDTVKQTEEKIESLKTELQMKEKEMSDTVKQNEEKLSAKEIEKQKMFHDYTEVLEQHRSKNDSLRKEMKEKEDKIQQYVQSLSSIQGELRATQRKVDSYKSRLASLSEKRVKQDQRFVEDTLGSNRQSELENDFDAFFDNERLDVCEKIQSIYHNKEDNYVFTYYPRLACIILETAYEQTKEAKETAIDLFKELTKHMIDCAAMMGKCFSGTRKLHKDGKHPSDFCNVPIANVAIWGEGSGYPKDSMEGMTLSLKEAAQNCNLDVLVQDVLKVVFMKWTQWCEEDRSCLFSPSFYLLQDLDKYIKACIRLTWRMVTQVPPMNLEYQCSKFNKTIHKKIRCYSNLKECERTQSSAQQNQEEEIACYLWPGLQDGGGRLIRAGEVLCKIREQDSSQSVRYH